MSKKHSKSAPNTLYVHLGHAAEHSIIKHDLLRVVVLNAIYLAAVLAVYYTNAKSHYLDYLLSHWLHF